MTGGAAGVGPSRRRSALGLTRSPQRARGARPRPPRRWGPAGKLAPRPPRTWAQPARGRPPAGAGTGPGPQHTRRRPNASQLQKHLCRLPWRGPVWAFTGCPIAAKFLISVLSTSGRCARRGPAKLRRAVCAARSAARTHPSSPAPRAPAHPGIDRGLRGDLSRLPCLLAPGVLGREVRAEGGGRERTSSSGTRAPAGKPGGQSLLRAGGRGEPAADSPRARGRDLCHVRNFTRTPWAAGCVALKPPRHVLVEHGDRPAFRCL